ncbi:hypothetical protein DKX38_013617 [Salix brachista]|uniref:Uncharacterized protein n=1 Tax=Salix brachista TaxID=2182728 RepID=A0A5N5LD71_9ROSI|nr:hypothetical protein DKX38_013617 [Salix brachista]
MADRPLPLSFLAITHEASHSIEVDFQMNITTWQSVISTDIKSHVLGGFPSRGTAAIRILMFHAYWTDINQLRFPHHVESLSVHNPHIMAFWLLRPPHPLLLYKSFLAYLSEPRGRKLREAKHGLVGAISSTDPPCRLHLHLHLHLTCSLLLFSETKSSMHWNKLEVQVQVQVAGVYRDADDEAANPWMRGRVF